MTTDQTTREEISGGYADLIRRVEFILDPTASARTRMIRRAHLTNHDLRTILAALQSPTDREGDRLLREMCEAMEYWAGCDESISHHDAGGEIMSSGGAWPSVSYAKARAYLSRSIVGEGE